MALAFGIASGAGAAAGLWGAILVGFFAALFGGTPSLISEPTGPMTVIVTAVIAATTASDPENGLAMAFTVVMLAGLSSRCLYPVSEFAHSSLNLERDSGRDTIRTAP